MVCVKILVTKGNYEKETSVINGFSNTATEKQTDR